ncbi:MAG: hypothetical protein JST54_06150 [Deltaproteobacteria bacterium]|nr:hypothetical protein [Deltaproteobacteria bacterium]
MRRVLGLFVVAALAVPGVAGAEAGKSFAALRDKAQPLESLSSFLSSFVGDCGSDPIDGAECKKKVDAYRKDSLGKSYYVILGDEAQRLIEQKGFSPQTHEMEFALTPFFESAGQALTHGQPTKLDSEGRPIIPLIRMQSTLPDNVTPMDVDRVFRTGNVRMQIVFKPLGLWKLPRHDKKGAFVEGVKGQLLGVRLSEARTGTDIAVWIPAK